LVFQPLQNKKQILVYKAPQQRPQTPCFLIFLTPRPFPGKGIHSKTLNLAVSSENAVFKDVKGVYQIWPDGVLNIPPSLQSF